VSITITNPVSEQEFTMGTSVAFEGTADSPITQIELWADDRWLLSKVTVSSGKWSSSYTFIGAGTRIIYAKGFDASKTLIETTSIWLFIEPSSDTDPAQKLTANFTLGELTFSQTAVMLRIDNTPTLGEIQRLRKLCEQILQPARDALGSLRISSGFRSKILNRAVGGVRNSDHQLGHAADVIPTNGDTRALAKWIVDNCEFDQVILEFGTDARPDWIHVSADPKNRKQILRAKKQGGRTVYSSIVL
jgi:hypothetical protein